MTDEKKLTSRQIEALEEKAFPERSSSRWGRMGGAVQRMTERLQEEGFLARPVTAQLRDEFGNDEGRRIGDALPDDLRRMGGYITLKGLRALESHYAQKMNRRVQDPTQGPAVDLPAVRALIPAQEKFDADLAAFIERSRSERDDRWSRQKEARKLAQAAELRDLFTKEGLNFTCDGEMLAFAKKVEAAQYSDRDVEFLSDDDLSAELDELEKTAVVIGTIGASQRDKRINVIRAEFVNRAEAA